MTGKLVFKMELFKILQDKKYIAITGVLAVAATIFTGYFSFMILNESSLRDDSMVWKFLPLMLILTVILVFAIMIFVYLFPFHILSIDYKNNVMAMMIASGVNRKNLYFSKMGAVVIASVCVSVIILIGPFIILITQVIANIDSNEIIRAFLDGYNQPMIENDFNSLQLFLKQILGVLNSSVIMLAATILMRGNNSTILLFLGFRFINGVIVGMAMTGVNFSDNYSQGQIESISMVWMVVSILVFGFIGLRTLNKQNL